MLQMGCKKKPTLLQYISLRGWRQCIDDRPRRLDMIVGTLVDPIEEVYKPFNVFVHHIGLNSYFILKLRPRSSE